MIPSFPNGATFRSLQISSVRIGRHRSINAITRSTYGGTTLSSHLHLGYRANRFAECVMNGTVSGDALIDHHTFFPLISEFFSTEVAQKWRTALVQGDLAIHKRFRATVAFQDLISRHCRLCPHCVEEDLRRHSIAFWRVYHQISLLDKCPEHNTPLRIQFCSRFERATSFGDEVTLPHDEFFRHAPANSQTPQGARQISTRIASPVQAAIARAFNRNAPEIRPELRKAVFSWHKRWSAKPSDELAANFKAWCEREELLQFLSINALQLKHFFDCGVTNNIVLILVASVFLWNQLPSDQKQLLLSATTIHPQSATATKKRGSMHSVLESELIELIARFSLPHELIYAILNGESHHRYIGSLDFLNLEQCLSVQSRRYFKELRANHLG